MEKITVILCEDEPVVQIHEEFMIASALEDMGQEFEILPFRHNRDAFQALSSRGHAENTILVTDGVMPDIDGPTFLKSLPDHLRPKEIIVCTGMPKKDFEATAGCVIPADSYLVKPVIEAVLVARLQKAVKAMMTPRVS